MGFNIGGTWNTTDVKNQTSTGWGLVLGKSFNYNYGSVISFDLRARYLRGMWYGQDNDTTSLLNYTGTALQEYKDQYGFTVNNFQSDVHRVALELALHLNSLRERSGWDPYIFGGVGLTFKQTYGDLLDQNNNSTLYDYSSMLANGPLQPQLSSALDKIYDSPLDGSSNAYQAYFMPSLGFGLGYQIGKRVSLGLEHKTTFTRGDDFDGYVSTTPRLKNDLYHYTSLYLNFRFRTRGNGNTTSPTDGTNSTGNINNFNTNCPPPIITFNTQNNQVVNFAQYRLDASVTELQNAQNVTIYNNLNQVVASNYNTLTKRVNADLVLVEGVNTITIKAQNNCGTDTKTFTITYNPCVSAKITFTNPVQGTIVKNSNFTVNAIITNVTNVAGIKFFENNIQVNGFSFDPISGLFTSNVALAPGLNTFKIEATNLCGTITSTASVTFDNCVSPTVQLINPSATGTTTNTAATTIQAFLKNVLSNQSVSVTQNGIAVTNFTLNNGQLIFPTTLVIGINTFVITASSSCGNASETFTINYQNCAAPVVTLNNPTNNSTVNAASLVFKSKIDNIAAKQNVSLKLNGIDINNFTYSTTTKLVQSTLQLQPGMNVISIGAINNCGSDIETIYVNYDNCIAPNVLIANTNTTVTNAAFVLNATIQNMLDAQGLSLTQNGNPVNFNYFNSQLTSALTLVPGNNTFVLTATKSCGTSTKTLIINYNNCIAPSVFILNPTASGSVVNASTLAFKASVTNITNAQQIVLKQNNQVIPFNYNNGLIEANATLSTGVNNFQITVTNACGTDTKTTAISFVNCTPPAISILNPVMNTTTINFAQFQFKAAISGSTNSQAVGLKVNGQDVTFNLSNAILTANLNLIPGVNTIIVSASNSCGTVIETSTITYDNCVPPTIQLTGIQNTTQTVTNPNFALAAVVAGINLPSNISFTQNGLGKSFNFANSNFSANLQLVEGLNTITLSATNSCGVAIKTLNITLNTCVPPTVSFTNPANSGTTIANAAFVFKANVQNIANTQGIVLKQNGATISNYSFVNGLITANVTLQAGLNTFSVVATNLCGVASETTTITFDNCVPPSINITNPTAVGTTVSAAAFNFRATVQNIASIQGLSLKQNGISTISNFSFVNGQISANVVLQPGLNTFTLVATNPCGVATESTSITFNNCVPPTVSFINPAVSGTTVATAAYNFKANVQNITTAQGISLKQNGTTISNFSFVNGQISANLTLQAGLNTFTIVATNVCGVATETTSITFDNCVPPTVSFTNPNNSGITVNRPSFNLTATIQNVSASGIVLTQNGTPITNFGFINGQLSHAVQLQDGLNTFVIVATNTCGTATQTITVNFSSCVTPVVAISNPSNGAAPVSASAYNFTASVQNITNAQGISLKLNGTSISNFTFSNGTIQASVTLAPGLNTFVLTATNACGTVSDTKAITYNNCIPPTVSISSPGANAIIVSAAAFNFLATVQNISSVQGISLKLNGTTISNFSFTNGNIQANVNLQEGLNSFILTATNACGTITDTETITFNSCFPPTAVINSPSANGTTVATGAYNFTASVQNITSAQGISLKLNGNTVSNFTFNNGNIQANVNLQEGLNTFVLTATNACGTVTETRTVIFACQLPTIVFNPTISRGSTLTYFFSATVTNVPSQQGINFTLNNSPITDFTFQSGIIQTTLSLQNGANTIRITATNACGTATRDTVINFGTCDAPVIEYLNPITEGSTVTNAFFNLSANIGNVTNPQGIEFKLNGAPTAANFSNGVLQATVTLRAGTNTFSITATNQCGNANLNSTIIYQSCVAPVINNTTSPASGSVTQNTSLNVSAVIQNYTQETNVTVKVNGNVVTAYSNVNGIITGILPLQNGTTSVELTATNSCGTDSDVYSITRCKPTTFSLINPSARNTAVTSPNQVIQFNIFNIDPQTTINITQNGTPNNNFSINGQLVVGNVQLVQGVNTFQVNTSNACNQLSETLTINYVTNGTTSPSTPTSPNRGGGNDSSPTPTNPTPPTNPNNNGGGNNNGDQRVNGSGKVTITPNKEDGKTNNGGKIPTNSETITTSPKNQTSTPTSTVTKPAATKVNTDSKVTTPTVKDTKKVESKPTEKDGSKRVESPKPKVETKTQIKGGGR